MNIKNAKTQIINTMKAYFDKDELGNYIIPPEKQRPIFLIGPPGIGKTAIMEQIASELGIGLIAYSMTHHTRQSAIGLPFISHKTYKDRQYDITEYTMSEIIASVYDLMEESGVEEGILFLDEVNCVSETLSPMMLQFLQYKTFGRHKLPEGWIVVTAGNPPEYNNSVHEFDIVTMDRLKIIDVEADYGAWKEYAYKAGVHGSILSFLELKHNCLYSVESTISGKKYVTPRGWEDLSRMLYEYEKYQLEINEDLIIQYLRDRKVAKEFSAYYDLYKKYQSEYQIQDVLSGKYSDVLVDRAAEAKFDEAYTLIGLLLDNIWENLKTVTNEFKLMEAYRNCITDYRRYQSANQTPEMVMREVAEAERKKYTMSVKSGALTQADKIQQQKTIVFLDYLADGIHGIDDFKKAFVKIKKMYDAKVKDYSDMADKAEEKLTNFLKFIEQCWGEGQEMLIAVTELTANYYSANFISTHGCDEYFKHNKKLLFSERQLEIRKKIESLEM